MDKKELQNPALYTNRELSWLLFNKRVLSEARDKQLLLFERLKFLSITASNLDEFFMVRIGSLVDMIHAEYTKKDIAYILERYRKDVRGNQRIIVTTEKDAVRLAANPYYPHELKAITYYLPIEVEFDTFGEKLPIVDEIEKRIKERLNSRN